MRCHMKYVICQTQHSPCTGLLGMRSSHSSDINMNLRQGRFKFPFEYITSGCARYVENITLP